MQGEEGTQAEASGYSAFISHAAEDRESAEAICQGLETSGFRCWIAPRDVRPGQVYLEEIIRGIELAKCLVLVLSRNANQANMVRDEVERAYNKGKPIFPVRIEEVLPSRGLELLVSTAHWIDAWRGNLSEHIGKLVLRLAEGADLIAELPPELQRRIRWRRRARTGAIFGGSAAIAILVALIMRSTLNENTRESYSAPPSVFFTGSLVGSNSPLKAGVLVQDGYDQDGAYEIFRNPVNFELFDVSNGKPEEFFKSVPEQFEATYRAASPFDITVPGLPIRVVSCLSYSITKTNRREAVLTGFGFNVPGSPAATYGIASIGPTETYPVDAKTDCIALVRDYTSKHLKGLKPLAEGRTMASRRQYRYVERGLPQGQGEYSASVLHTQHESDNEGRCYSSVTWVFTEGSRLRVNSRLEAPK
jgi:TIR domain